jgi:hypothetical protein
MIMVLNYLDSLAIGFQQKLYDEDLAKDHMAPIVRLYRNQYLDTVLLKSMGIDPADYHCLITLADNWSIKPPACTARSNPAGRHAPKRHLKTLETGTLKRSKAAPGHAANRHPVTA